MSAASGSGEPTGFLYPFIEAGERDATSLLDEAFAEASGRGLCTVGFAGYGGGAMAASGDVAHCLVVACDSVQRTQEAREALLLALWQEVQRCLAGHAAAVEP